MLINNIIVILLLSFIPINNSITENYPTPPINNKLLFYIQRNLNTNTIIYNANFDNKGNLIKEKPIDVFWLRYDEQGQRMELRTLEKRFAYGVNCENIKKDQYKVELVAKKDREFILIQKAPYKASIYTKINNITSRLKHMYIQADNSSFWPSVEYIELFGTNIKTEEKSYEKIMN